MFKDCKLSIVPAFLRSMVAIFLVFFLQINMLKGEEGVAKLIEQNLKGIVRGVHIKVSGQQLHSSLSLPEFYRNRNYLPAWQDKDYRNANILIAEITEALYDGLTPNDYHCDHLIILLDTLKKSSSDKLKAELDILLTDAFLMLTAHLYKGKTDPVKVKADWGIQRAFADTANIAQVLEKSIQNNAIQNAIQEFKPNTLAYKRLRELLKKHYYNNAIWDWEELKSDSTLKLGMYNSLIPLVRKRLNQLGDFETEYMAYSQSLFFDSTLFQTIKIFQYRHGLAQDGEIGRRTLEQLNINPQKRIETIRANLERMRWLPRNMEKVHVLVNIPQFKLFYIKESDTLFKTKAIVGRLVRKTPVFSASISYMVFSPTWTIPPGILNQDVLPAVRKNPNYLKQHNMVVVDRQGNPVPDELINFHQSRFPYMIKQTSGPHNALGAVKFMFPNPYSVYVHDTPSKNLFAGAERAYSSGCIRIEKAFEFAKILLQDRPEWTEDSIINAMNRSSELRVTIRPEIPIYIAYFTAWSDGVNVYFRNDLYKRDEELIKGLNESVFEE